MRGLLIVDDEPLVRIGLGSMLDWTALGISIVGTASNGQKAYEFILKRAPDLAIVDLRMPLMDGMELIERCAGLGTEFIILTSAEDFQYARQAIHYGVTDYLLKLELTEESLAEAVAKALARLDERRPMTKTPRIADPPFVETIVVRLLERGLVDSAAAEEASAAMELPNENGEYRAAFFHLELANDRALSAEEAGKLYNCTADLVRQIFGREGKAFTAPLDRHAFAAIIYYFERSDQYNTGDQRARAAAAKVRELASKYFSVTLAIGLGSTCFKLQDIADSYDEARRAADISIKENRVVDFEQLHISALSLNPAAVASKKNFDYQSALSEALDKRSPDAIYAAFNKVLRLIHGKIARLPIALDLCCRIHRLLLKWADDDEKVLDSYFPVGGDGCKSLYRAASVDHLAIWLEHLRDGVANDLKNQPDSRSRQMVQLIKRFLDERYTEKITVSGVAERFSISPNYLSSVFKQEEGIGFSEYLAAQRIAKAKILIRETNKKVYEISDEVGFDDAYYFSKVFKRVCGQTPSEYRTRCRSGI